MLRVGKIVTVIGFCIVVWAEWESLENEVSEAWSV
jgi:hypothetical protein